MALSQILGSILSRDSYPASLITHIYWNTKYSFIREQSHHNHFTALKHLLKTKSMSEIKDMYDRHRSIKSITSITVITRRVVSIDFYRLIDTIDNVYVIDIDSYRFIERFSDIDFYRLPTSGHMWSKALFTCGPWICVGSHVNREKDSANTSCFVNNNYILHLLFIKMAEEIPL